MITTEIKRVKITLTVSGLNRQVRKQKQFQIQRLEKLSLTFHYLQKKMLKKLLKRQKQRFETWSKVPVPNRSRNLYKYLQLLQENKDELAKIITLENGKTLTDATGEVQRGIEAVELATSTPNLMMGQALPNIASGIDIDLALPNRSCCWYYAI